MSSSYPAQHGPLPFRYEQAHPTLSLINDTIRDANGNIVAVLSYTRQGQTVGGDAIPPAEREANGALLAAACNAYAVNLATIASAARDLEMVADMLETGPAPKPETLRNLAAAYRATLHPFA